MKKLMMVTMSEHTTFQDSVFSMYNNLKEKYEVCTITLKESDYPVTNDKNNIFIEAPKRPGITICTFNLLKLYDLMNKVIKFKPNIVYFESFHIWNYVIILYCKFNRIEVAHAINDVIPHKGDSMVRIKDWLNGFTVLISNRVVLRSQNGLDSAVKRFPRYIDKMYKVNLWCSFPPYCPPKGNSVLFFGRINRYKGLRYLFDLAKRTPDIEYIVAGKADENEINIVNELSGLPNVKMNEGLIPYNKIDAYFYDSLCTILPYETATQSGVVLESYKHSRPVVAFNVGALEEQVEHGVTGYLAKAGIIDELEQYLRLIMNMSKENYEKMCREAYRKGLNDYSAIGRENEFLKAIGM